MVRFFMVTLKKGVAIVKSRVDYPVGYGVCEVFGEKKSDVSGMEISRTKDFRNLGIQ